jgi:hypothetical protein
VGERDAVERHRVALPGRAHRRRGQVRGRRVGHGPLLLPVSPWRSACWETAIRRWRAPAGLRSSLMAMLGGAMVPLADAGMDGGRRAT